MNLTVDVKDWKLILVAAALALPFFIVVNGTSVSLPENYFQVTGIPVHANALLFLLLPKRVLMNNREFFIFLAFLIYCIISLFHSGERFQLAIQLGYFIYGYKIMNGLNERNIRSLDHFIAVFGIVLILTHGISICYEVINGNLVSAGTQGIFGFVVYQSHLTYPLVIIFLLVSISRSFRRWNILRIFVILLALLIEVVLMRRVGFALFCFFLLLFEHRILIFSFFAGFLSFIAFSDFRATILEAFTFAERLTQFTSNGNFSRAMTWERSIERLSDPSTILLGNGLNNHSHNFFLHTINTHGLLVSILVISLIGFWIFLNLFKNGRINNYSILGFAIVFIDWNLNVNIYQPYYSLLFAFFLISTSRISKGAKNGL